MLSAFSFYLLGFCSSGIIRFSDLYVLPEVSFKERRINETAKILYCVLFHRAKPSLKSEKRIDKCENAFVSFSLKELANVIGKSEMTVKSSLRALEGIDLISRKRRGIGLTNRIYVKVPPFTERQNIILLTEKKPSPPYISNNKDKDYKRIYECKEEESL